MTQSVKNPIAKYAWSSHMSSITPLDAGGAWTPMEIRQGSGTVQMYFQPTDGDKINGLSEPPRIYIDNSYGLDLEFRVNAYLQQDTHLTYTFLTDEVFLVPAGQGKIDILGIDYVPQDLDGDNVYIIMTIDVRAAGGVPYSGSEYIWSVLAAAVRIVGY